MPQMLSLFAIALIVLPIAYALNWYRLLQREIAAAKKSGLPYVVVPFYLYNRLWLVLNRLLLPAFEYYAPQSWQGLWVKLLEADWSWEYGHEPFEELESDVFLTVSAGGTMVWIASAEVNTQVVNRRIDFPKALALYKSLNIYGVNVVTTEGALWRQHRKITSPSFTEKNNGVVWRETMDQATAMMQSYFSTSSTSSSTITDLPSDAMRLTLHIISKAGFGVSLAWPKTGTQKAEDDSHVQSTSADIPKGHTMSYASALQTLLHHIILLIVTPRWILKRSTFDGARITYESFIEWGRYQQEIFDGKKDEIRNGTDKEGLDLMGALIKGAGITKESLERSDRAGIDKSRPSTDSAATKGQLVSDDEILGNAFVFIVAGHETTGNTIHFTILNLALNLPAQRRLQAHLDQVLDDRPAETMELDKDFQKLAGGYTGAVLNETLRLFPPVTVIPKLVSSHSPQPITLNGKSYVLPAGAAVNLNVVPTHKNPAYWPPEDPSDPDDLEKFKPERWIQKHGSKTGGQAEGEIKDDNDVEGPTGQGTSANLFQPIRGSYLPFSDGYRGCLGRRFAQVEMAASMSVMFSRFSVELAVDEWASDEEVERMDAQQRKKVWDLAVKRATWLMKEGTGTRLTLQLQRGNVKVRFVERGTERFDFT